MDDNIKWLAKRREELYDKLYDELVRDEYRHNIIYYVVRELYLIVSEIERYPDIALSGGGNG